MSLLQVQGDFNDFVLQYRENPYPALALEIYSYRKVENALAIAVLSIVPTVISYFFKKWSEKQKDE